MLEPDLISRIRHIFLHPRPHVSISQAAGLCTYRRHGGHMAGDMVDTFSDG